MIYVEMRNLKKRVEAKTVKELMKKLGLSSENYVISKNGEIVLEDEKLSDGDKVKLFPVISGG